MWKDVAGIFAGFIALGMISVALLNPTGNTAGIITASANGFSNIMKAATLQG